MEAKIDIIIDRPMNELMSYDDDDIASKNNPI
jgi:hypothetical protein